MAQQQEVVVKNIRHLTPREGTITKFVFDLFDARHAKKGELPSEKEVTGRVKSKFKSSKFDARHYSYFRYHWLRNRVYLASKASK